MYRVGNIKTKITQLPIYILASTACFLATHTSVYSQASQYNTNRAVAQNEITKEQKDTNTKSSPEENFPIPVRLDGYRFLFNTYFKADYIYDLYNQKSPTAEANPKLVNQSFINHYTNLYLGLNLFHETSQKSEVNLGYLYNQSWQSPHERFQKFTNSKNISKDFPFKVDLMRRIHSLYASYSMIPLENTKVGGEIRYDKSTKGSKLIYQPAEDGTNFQLNDYSSLLLSPYFSYQTDDYGTFSLYLYLKRQLNESNEQNTFKTYDTTEGFDISWGINNRYASSTYNFELINEIYYYSYKFNNFINDFKRIGYYTKLNYFMFSKKLIPSLLISYSKDSFENKELIQNSCAFPDGSQSTLDTKKCNRTDTNLLISGELNYLFKKNHQVGINYSKINNSSNFSSINDRNEVQYKFSYGYRLGSSYRSSQMTDNIYNGIYGKKAYTYEQP